MPKTLEDVIEVALEVEKFDKENDRMVRRVEETILHYNKIGVL